MLGHGRSHRRLRKAGVIPAVFVSNPDHQSRLQLLRQINEGRYFLGSLGIAPPIPSSPCTGTVHWGIVAIGWMLREIELSALRLQDVVIKGAGGSCGGSNSALTSLQDGPRSTGHVQVTIIPSSTSMGTLRLSSSIRTLASPAGPASLFNTSVDACCTVTRGAARNAQHGAGRLLTVLGVSAAEVHEELPQVRRAPQSMLIQNQYNNKDATRSSTKQFILAAFTLRNYLQYHRPQDEIRRQDEEAVQRRFDGKKHIATVIQKLSEVNCVEYLNKKCTETYGIKKQVVADIRKVARYPGMDRSRSHASGCTAVMVSTADGKYVRAGISSDWAREVCLQLSYDLVNEFSSSAVAASIHEGLAPFVVHGLASGLLHIVKDHVATV